MKTLLHIILLVFLSSSFTFGQIGFDNDSPDPSAVLDLTATDKGLLIPRMTTQEREAIASPANSLLVFDTSVNNYFYYINNQWVSLSQWSSSTSNSSIFFETGNVGIGKNNPFFMLDVNGPVNTTALFINGTQFSAADLHPVSNGSAAKTATGDWNDYVNTGFYMGQNLLNRPPHVSGGHSWHYVTVIKHNHLHVVQYATDFSNIGTWTRVLLNGVWKEWKPQSYYLDKTILLEESTVNAQINTQIGGEIINLGTNFSVSGTPQPRNPTRNGGFLRIDTRDGPISTSLFSVFFQNTSGVNSNPFSVGYQGNLYCTGSLSENSDIRLKDNIVIIDNALDKIKRINGVYYTRKDQDDRDKQHIGVIADDLLKVVPELVQVPDDSEEMKSVNYSKLTALLIEGIKQQQLQAEELVERLEAQQEEIDELKRKLK